jgi:hypothetical protein
MKIYYEIEVSCEPNELFPWIENPEKALLWQKGVKKGEILKETPERIGTTFIEEMEEDGNRLEMHGEITGYIRNKMITFHLESKIHHLDVSYSIAGNGGRSILSVDSKIIWKFPMNIISIILGHRIKRGIMAQMGAEFAELKRLCEKQIV